MSKSSQLPSIMRAILGEQTFRDVDVIVTKLSELELRGAISPDWHGLMIDSLAEELVTQQIANDVAKEACEAAPGAASDAL